MATWSTTNDLRKLAHRIETQILMACKLAVAPAVTGVHQASAISECDFFLCNHSTANTIE